MIKDRDFNLDVIRGFAALCVICVHFFMNVNFYDYPILGKKMYLMTFGQTSFMICVPLFIILTGYLMNRKRLEKKYYFGIVKILWSYIICGLVCILFKRFYQGQAIAKEIALTQILNFSSAPYAWYIEMYVGLFLMIPFLNLIYNGLKDKSEKRMLIATMVILTVLPTIINIEEKTVGDWWTKIYPLTYYFIGAYISEYKVKINMKLNAFLIVSLTLMASWYNIYMSEGGVFRWGGYNDWNGMQNVVRAVLVFIFLSNIRFRNVPNVVRKVMQNIADHSLSIYLISYISDTVIYQYIKSTAVQIPDRVYYFVPAVLGVFILSWVMAYICDLTYIPVGRSINRIKGRMVQAPNISRNIDI